MFPENSDKLIIYAKEVVTKQKSKIRRTIVRNWTILYCLSLELKLDIMFLINLKDSWWHKRALHFVLALIFLSLQNMWINNWFFLWFECFYKQLCILKPRFTDEETATKVNLSSLAYNYSKSKPEISSLLDFSEIRNIVKELKNHNNLIISKPDKEIGCV